MPRPRWPSGQDLHQGLGESIQVDLGVGRVGADPETADVVAVEPVDHDLVLLEEAAGDVLATEVRP